MNVLHNIMHAVFVVLVLYWIVCLVMLCRTYMQYQKAEQTFWDIYVSDIEAQNERVKQAAIKHARKDKQNDDKSACDDESKTPQELEDENEHQVIYNKGYSKGYADGEYEGMKRFKAEQEDKTHERTIISETGRV